jgi:hypothetical protein
MTVTGKQLKKSPPTCLAKGLFPPHCRLDSPQTRHKLKKSGSENGGFLRVSADQLLWREVPIVAMLWKAMFAKSLNFMVERVKGIEPSYTAWKGFGS